MLLQLPNDFVHVHFRLAVLGLHCFHFIPGLLEKAENTALILFLLAEIFQLDDQAGQRFAHLAQVLRPHAFQCAL